MYSAHLVSRRSSRIFEQRDHHGQRRCDGAYFDMASHVGMRAVQPQEFSPVFGHIAHVYRRIHADARTQHHGYAGAQPRSDTLHDRADDNGDTRYARSHRNIPQTF